MGDRRGIERGWWYYDALGSPPPVLSSPLPSVVKKALYTNQADFLTLYSYKGSFYALGGSYADSNSAECANGSVSGSFCHRYSQRDAIS